MSKHGIVADLLFGAIETTLAPVVAVVEGVTGDVSKEATDGVFRAIVDPTEAVIDGLINSSK
jgi:hypothetical protein